MNHIFQGKVLKEECIFVFKWGLPRLFILASKLNEDDMNLYAKKDIQCKLSTTISLCSWETFAFSDKIEERVLEGSLVRINGQDYSVREVIQEDDGSVICHLNHIIRIEKDDEDKKRSQLLYDVYLKLKNIYKPTFVPVPSKPTFWQRLFGRK